MLKRILVVCAMLSFAALFAQEFTVELSTDKESGIYSKGETIRFRIQALQDGKPVAGKQIACVFRCDGKANQEQVITTTEEPFVWESPLDRPGWTWITAGIPGENGKMEQKGRKSIGAMMEPETILPGGEEPADFDAFWKGQRELLDKVPVKFTVEEVPVPKDREGKFLCYDVKVDCAGGMPVSGYFTIPVGAENGSLKAEVVYHGAGVRSSGKRFRSGVMVFDVNAHGIENGKPGEFYRELDKGTLRNYPHKNKNDREKIYFNAMFLRVMRAMDFMMSRPEWDGKTLAVAGHSQGGGQALAAAALEPRVTFCHATVPALCDHGGLLQERRSGWPYFLQLKNGKITEPEVAKAVAYYDCAFFARRIKAETCISVGLCDGTCPPTSVYATYNSIPAGTRKMISVYPRMGHGWQDKAGSTRANELLRR